MQYRNIHTTDPASGLLPFTPGRSSSTDSSCTRQNELRFGQDGRNNVRLFHNTVTDAELNVVASIAV